MNLGKKLRATLIAGTLALIPLTFTYLTLRYLFEKLDGLLMPLVVRALILAGAPVKPGEHLPGVGLLATLAVIFLTGLLTRNYAGRKLWQLWEWALGRIPLVNSIYFAAKQLVEAFALPGKRTAFREVVLVEYPRRGIWSVGFITSDIVQRYHETTPPLVPVIMPHTPTPLTGCLILVPREDIIPLPISVEEGIKLIVSGGILTPMLAEPTGGGE